MNRIIGKSLLVAGLTLSTVLAHAEDNQALIELARSAAPDSVSAEATVMYRGEVLAEGSNGWVCMPETLPDDNSPMCNDAVWMEMMQAVGAKAPFEAKQMGFSYMLQGDGEAGGVSNSDPYHADRFNAEDFIREGPHLMIIVPKAMMSGITDDPAEGGPYIMWNNTPYAHVMVPIADR
ncbi:hypothetical protein [Marinobacterium sediminicola]|uniref:Uncharacterized protein n=1 Tax=Marinobacterium sediminicola TaxID=518898 RepID=A0ABY1S309_9GAMM|nr:hypothetical protein [Marinobacterium sediminicola]ULG69301.1 hypothetical protein LN244_00365 [Marinobacterium sediminicola]SMR77652.1 hypothetical protein SAMN04487964_11570 [Marinobacterium sediminicola]